MKIWKVEHSSPSVGCARNTRQCRTVLQNRKLFRWMLDGEWTDYLLWTCDEVVTEVFCSSNSTKSPKTKPATGNCLRDPERDRTSEPKQNGNRDVDQLSHVDHVTTNAHSSQGESSVLHFRRQRSCDQDHQGQKSDNETRVENPQSCA